MFFPAHLRVSGRRRLLRQISPLICLTVIALKSVDLAAALPQPVQPVPDGALLALAQKKFGTLSRAEEELFLAAQEGRAASVLSKDEKENDPDNAANWPADRVVRAECISWMCTDPQASALVTHRGLELHGMRIVGALNLVYAEIKFPFAAWKCSFAEEISLRDAQIRGFYLLDCRLKSLDGNRTIFQSSVLLRDGLKTEGEINLLGAKIGGDLDCSGAQLSNAKGQALNADGAQIEGTVFLNNRLIPNGSHISFKADGEVNLMGATIGGNLDCEDGQFSNANGPALNAEGAKINGNVFLRTSVKAEGEVTRFEADGEVNLMGATIGGNLDCEGGQFSNVNGPALSADMAKISGSVFLRRSVEAEGEVRPFKAEGEVNLSGATIAGDLDCQGGQFSNAKRPALDGQFSSGERPALNANAADIKGGVYLRGGFGSEGEVNLVRATIGDLQIRGVTKADQLILDLGLAKVESFWDDEKSWPQAEKRLFLDGFRYERLYQDAPLQPDSRKRWLRLQPRDKFSLQPYEQLAAVLRQMGHDWEARQIMIEKNRERARFAHFPHQDWWWYNVFGRFTGYGYEPWRVFAASVGTILVGTLVLLLGSKHHLIGPTSDNAYAKTPNGQVIKENGRKRILDTYPVFNAFVYSLESFVPLLKLDQSAHWRPNANRGAEIPILPFWAPRTGSLLRGYLCLHIAAGWLLTTLWLGAVTGLMKT